MGKDCGCNKSPIIGRPIMDLKPIKKDINTQHNYFSDYTKLERDIVAQNLGMASGSVIINNYPDEEDLTTEKCNRQNVLKFRNKKFEPKKYSGYGRVILRKSISVENCKKTKNILTQSMFEDENGVPMCHTIFIIQYDFDLNGDYIQIPNDSILWFVGGSLFNGTLLINNTRIYPQGENIEELTTCIIRGNYKEGQMFYSNGTLRYWNGKGWIELNGGLISNTETQEKHTVYWGTTDKESIDLSDLDNFNTIRMALEDSPLTRFDNHKYIYWIIPTSWVGQLSVYTDGIRNTNFEDNTMNINGVLYTSLKLKTPQADDVESQLKIIKQ